MMKVLPYLVLVATLCVFANALVDLRLSTKFPLPQAARSRVDRRQDRAVAADASLLGESVHSEGGAIQRTKHYASKMMSCSGVASPGYMIAGVKGNRTLFAESIGKASLSPSVPSRPNTLWPIGSCTKSFTAILIGRLVDQGLLHWNTPVASVLPGFSTNNAVTDTATVRDLLSMQLGIPRNDVAWFAGRAGNMSHNIQTFHVLESASPLRQTFWYNNFGFSFLGRIVELLTNQTWSDAVKTQIFAPLGMNQSSTLLSEALASGRFAYPHVIDASTGGAINTLPYNLNGMTIDQVAAAGSISLTASDAAKYMAAIASPTLNNLLTAPTSTFLHERGVMSLSMHDGSQDDVINFVDDHYGPVPFQLFTYGGGWMHGSYKNRNVIVHNGGTLGHSTWLFRFPDNDLTFIMASNMDGLSPMSRYMWDWALYARDQFVGDSPNSVRTSTICDRFNIKTGGPSLAYVDDSYISDYQLTSVFDEAYVASIVGVYSHEFYGLVNVSAVGTNSTSAAFDFGTLHGLLMTGPYTGNAFFSLPSFYQVQALAAAFNNFSPTTGKAGTLQLGIEVLDPVFVRVD